MTVVSQSSYTELIARLERRAMRDYGPLDEIPLLLGSADALITLATERDQALENLRASEKMRDDLRVVLTQNLAIFAAVNERVSSAPHDHYEPCGPTNYLRSQGVPEDELPECVCWKAGL